MSAVIPPHPHFSEEVMTVFIKHYVRCYASTSRPSLCILPAKLLQRDSYRHCYRWVDGGPKTASSLPAYTPPVTVETTPSLSSSDSCAWSPSRRG